MTYVTRQVVVHEGANETVVFDEVINAVPEEVVSDLRGHCQWSGNRYLLIKSRQGHLVVDVDDDEQYVLPPEYQALGVRVFEKGTL